MPITVHNQVNVSFGDLEIVCENHKPLTLRDALDVFPTSATLIDQYFIDTAEIVHEICDILREGCHLQGSHEHLFLLLYFNRVSEKLRSGMSLSSIYLPLPKARFSIGEQRSISVDFVFWTGERFIAVFIHESSYDRHGRAEEGLLKVWGFDVYCLMADEFETRGLMGVTGLKILDELRLR